MKYEQGLAKALQKRKDSGDSLGLWTKLGERCVLGQMFYQIL